MATHSFYIPNDQDVEIMSRLHRIAQRHETSVSDLITDILRRYLEKAKKSKVTGSQWANSFCGAWKGRAKNKDLVQSVESSRTRFKSKPFM
jgi:hypothetical protein